LRHQICDLYHCDLKALPRLHAVLEWRQACFAEIAPAPKRQSTLPSQLP
jgi:hypothetical protein